jgi:NAD(P)-dependent dehydrogenase (short-subunit alcohol dehydrogenase family)
MSRSEIKRTTLITGASRGLGSAIALEQAATCTNVAINYFKNDQAAERICERIQQNGGRAHAFKADVRDEGEVVRLVSTYLEELISSSATLPDPSHFSLSKSRLGSRISISSNSS